MSWKQILYHAVSKDEPPGKQLDMKELRDRGIDIPTRGSIQDIRPTISHKTRIVELWLKGFEYTEIELRTNHSRHSIKRYLVDFSRIFMLQDKGYTVNLFPGSLLAINSSPRSIYDV
jgi:hypothetical protein